jgi:hypothetical protein
VGSPVADRPVMPGYGVLPAAEGSGLISWAETERRLGVSHEYWCATVWPDGRPHLMPVWGVWHEGALWFSSGLRSRKARNLAADPRCSLATDDPLHPAVLEGQAERVVDGSRIEGFRRAVNAKYDSGITADFLDPAVNGTYAVHPRRVIALTEDDFSGSPTRWTFSPA